MAITQIQSKKVHSSGTSITVTFDAPVAAGNHIVLVAAAHTIGVVSSEVPTDTLTDEYNRDFSTYTAEPGDVKLLEMFSATIKSNGTPTITYTVSGTADLWVEAQEWQGFYADVAYGGGPGAAYVDHGFGLGATTPPPFTQYFATDFADLANFYGFELPLVSVSAAFQTSLLTSYEYYPNANYSVTVSYPFVPFGQLAVFINVLYVGPVIPKVLSCTIQIVAAGGGDGGEGGVACTPGNDDMTGPG